MIASEGVNQEEKEIILQKLANRINEDGILSITSQKSRSQLDNKENSVSKLNILLIKALTPVAKRIRTKPSLLSIEERLTEKKRNAEKKITRRKPSSN